MFAHNPFSELSSLIPPIAMQTYVIVMLFLVIGGTLLDMIHKKSAKYFFENAEKAKKNRVRELSSGDKVSIAVQTLLVDVLTSAEFCNQLRRVAHLFKMYGFITFIVTTMLLIFKYPTPSQPAPEILPVLWHIGALMVCAGGYVFWFFLRVDMASEGNRKFRLVRADMFIVSLLGTTTFALLWSAMQSSGVEGWTTAFFILFLISSTVLFGGVLWSKFAHMFFKPAAAYHKRTIKADGSLENLPEMKELTDPELQKRFPDIPEYMGSTPPPMGLGIKREKPRHY
ncbi:MAG: adenylyl-sulfate reductase [Magnetococcales bacterium]|nr:adenylyl-sulfate reductase [Magnetococcales bacterium]